jgi:hypothetical protein
MGTLHWMELQFLLLTKLSNSTYLLQIETQITFLCRVLFYLTFIQACAANLLKWGLDQQRVFSSTVMMPTHVRRQATPVQYSVVRKHTGPLHILHFEVGPDKLYQYVNVSVSMSIIEVGTQGDTCTLTRGVMLTTHPHLVSKSRMSRSHTSPPSAAMACSGTAFVFLCRLVACIFEREWVGLVIVGFFLSRVKWCGQHISTKRDLCEWLFFSEVNELLRNENYKQSA